MLEILRDKLFTPVRAVLFDFDGTISTLRCGWEEVMERLMLDMISGGAPISEDIHNEIKEYIDVSTGVQTIWQMKWLAEAVVRHGLNPNMPTDPWWYKDEYNTRLMLNVSKRRDDVLSGRARASDYMILGAQSFLQSLALHDVKLYVASGTDIEDVRAEASALGVDKYFEDIRGAMPMSEACSKEAALRALAEECGYAGDDIAVIGDGMVEIELGASLGARTIGIASDERALMGVNPKKYARLRAANADAITGDFRCEIDLLNFLGLEELPF